MRTYTTGHQVLLSELIRISLWFFKYETHLFGFDLGINTINNQASLT